MLEVIDERTIYGTKGEKAITITDYESEYNKYKKIISPIIIDGTVVGSVIFLSNDDKKKFNELEIKLLQIVAEYLTREME